MKFVFKITGSLLLLALCACAHPAESSLIVNASISSLGQGADSVTVEIELHSADGSLLSAPKVVAVIGQLATVKVEDGAKSMDFAVQSKRINGMVIVETVARDAQGEIVASAVTEIKQ